MARNSNRIEAFRGLLYDPSRAGKLSDVIAPPYDLIGAAMQARLYERSPYNIVRIELGREPDRYESSARTLRNWIESGVLGRAASPAIYHYTQRFAVAGRRLTRVGLMVRLKLEPFDSGRIRPHERTFPAAKEDRMRLLTATETNVSPIFGLYAGRLPELAALREQVAAREPLLAATDELGIENELREISDGGEIESIQRALESPRTFMLRSYAHVGEPSQYIRASNAAAGCEVQRSEGVLCDDGRRPRSAGGEGNRVDGQ